tara:strand:+ start:1963 stop:2292 length:330 start_codon:yes stop_codon:yes gene_type:complete
LYATTSWELRVHQANFDVEAHELTNSEYKAYLDKTSWRCWADKPTKSSNLDIRALRCNYSVEQLGAFKSHASCGPGKIFDEVAIDLRDERKNLDLKVILICRYKSDSNS